jgi:hypothetical protein
LIDQRRGCRKAHSPALTAGGDSQAGGKMTLAGAEVAEPAGQARRGRPGYAATERSRILRAS